LRTNLHDRIVQRVLPKLAQELQKKGVISSYTKKNLKIKTQEIFSRCSLPPFVIKPDLLLILPDNKKLLVEVVNPEDPKRFIGELIYAKILIHHKKITAALFFVLNPEKQWVHKRSLSQIHALSFLHLPKGSRTATWPDEEDKAYRTLKGFVERFTVRSVQKQKSCV
jgi:hypothetical protein